MWHTGPHEEMSSAGSWQDHPPQIHTLPELRDLPDAAAQPAGFSAQCPLSRDIPGSCVSARTESSSAGGRQCCSGAGSCSPELSPPGGLRTRWPSQGHRSPGPSPTLLHARTCVVCNEICKIPLSSTCTLVLHRRNDNSII